jgi:hypothetical protein
MSITAITFPGEQYIARGTCATTDRSQTKWADEFKALGGQRCRVIAGWQYGIEHTATAVVTGTPAAIAFVFHSLTN